jgi:MFS family permease
MGCLVLFTASSFFCGIAPSLVFLLLVARVVQAAGGGRLQPMAQAILADVFPPQQRGLAFALYGITAVMAPTIGPTLGGWLTDNYSWHSIFFINLPVGALTLLLVARLVEDPPHATPGTRAGVRLDYIGIGLPVLGIGALQVVLDRGQEDDWFGSSFITALAIPAALRLLALVVWKWFQEHPIIDVRLFRNFNFLSANIMMFMLGLLLFVPITLAAYVGMPPARSNSVAGLINFMRNIGCLSSFLTVSMPGAYPWRRVADNQCNASRFRAVRTVRAALGGLIEAIAGVRTLPAFTGQADRSRRPRLRRRQVRLRQRRSLAARC